MRTRRGARLPRAGNSGASLPVPMLDAEAGDAPTRDHAREEMQRRIVELHPGLLGASGRAPITHAIDVVSRIDRQPFRLPHGDGRPLVFFVPWLTRGGGGERFVSDLGRGLVWDGRTVAVVVTVGCPEGMTDATEDMLNITPYVYDLTRFLQPGSWFPFCKSVVWRLNDPILMNIGSTWMYDNLRALRRSGRGSVTVVDQLFNPIGHVARSVSVGEDIDLILTAYTGLERLLVDRHKVASASRLSRSESTSRSPKGQACLDTDRSWAGSGVCRWRRGRNGSSRSPLTRGPGDVPARG